MTQDRYEHWRRALAGDFQSIDADTPSAGFYRSKRADKQTGDITLQPVAFWYDQNDKLVCKVGNKMVDDLTARELWPFVCRNPVTHGAYGAVMSGGAWPDQHEAVIRDRVNSENAPDEDSFEALKDRIEDLVRDAEREIKSGAAPDQSAADRASDLANRLAELQKKADAARKAEKKPHDEAAAAVQAKWTPLVGAAGIYKRLKDAVIAPFLVAEAKKQREAAEAQRRAAEQAAKDGAPIPEATPTKKPPKAGSGGRRSVALRSVKIVKITDRDALLAFFALNDQITATLQTLAERAVAAGVSVPGVSVSEEMRAA